MISFEPNPRFARKSHVRDSEYGMSIFIQYTPAGFWAEMVTLSLEFQKVEEGTEIGANNEDVVNGYWLKFDISCAAGGRDDKSSVTKLEAMDCLAAALSDATQMVRDIQLMFLKGSTLLEIGQAVWKIDLPMTSQRNTLVSLQKEIAITRLPNDVFMCDGLLWADKHDAEAYVKALNPEAQAVETQISQREQNYWWFILKHARAKVLRQADIPQWVSV